MATGRMEVYIARLEEKLLSIQDKVDSVVITIKKIENTQEQLTTTMMNIKQELQGEINRHNDRLWRTINDIEKWQYKIIGLAVGISTVLPIVLIVLQVIS